MSRDILEAMTALAREKGISPEKLMAALEVSSPVDKYRRQRASSTASETKESPQ